MSKKSVKTLLITLYSFKILNAEALLKLCLKFIRRCKEDMRKDSMKRKERQCERQEQREQMSETLRQNTKSEQLKDLHDRPVRSMELRPKRTQVHP